MSGWSHRMGYAAWCFPTVHPTGDHSEVERRCAQDPGAAAHELAEEAACRGTV